MNVNLMDTEQWKLRKSPSLPLKIETCILILWFYSILPRTLQNMVHVDSVDSCACFSFSRARTLYPCYVAYCLSSLVVLQMIMLQITFWLEGSPLALGVVRAVLPNNHCISKDC